jgi:hypothetical protein
VWRRISIIAIVTCMDMDMGMGMDMYMGMGMNMDMVITTAMATQDTVLLQTRQKPKSKPTKIRPIF